MKQPFVVLVDVPEGVSLAEIASHLSDSSRAMTNGYDANDPMSALGEIDVFAGVAQGALPPG